MAPPIGRYGKPPQQKWKLLNIWRWTKKFPQQKRNKLLDEVTEQDKELDLDLDTYTMAFRALLWDTIREIELKEMNVLGKYILTSELS